MSINSSSAAEVKSLLADNQLKADNEKGYGTVPSQSQSNSSSSSSSSLHAGARANFCCGRSQDFFLIFLSRALRMFSYGSISLIFFDYMKQSHGLSLEQTGVLLTCILIGDLIITLWLTTSADRMGRRNTLAIGAILKIFSGIGFAYFTNFYVLAVIGIVGVITPTGSEIGFVTLDVYVDVYVDVHVEWLDISTCLFASRFHRLTWIFYFIFIFYLFFILFYFISFHFILFYVIFIFICLFVHLIFVKLWQLLIFYYCFLSFPSIFRHVLPEDIFSRFQQDCSIRVSPRSRYYWVSCSIPTLHLRTCLRVAFTHHFYGKRHRCGHISSFRCT
jgi:MFS family permease